MQRRRFACSEECRASAFYRVAEQQQPQTGARARKRGTPRRADDARPQDCSDSAARQYRYAERVQRAIHGMAMCRLVYVGA
jgi:hypothetical protein